jgi:hypothetical protein
MLEYNKRKVLYSIHIPKTGGTSLNQILYDWFWPGLHAHYYDHKYNKLPRKVRPFKYWFHSLGLYPLCINGHFVPRIDGGTIPELYPGADQYITIIRDPLEMQVSLFYNQLREIKKESLYWLGKPQKDMEYEGDLDLFVTERHSYLLEFFPFKFDKSNYKEAIDSTFVHIGTTEKLQLSIDILADKLKKKRVTVPQLNTSERTASPSEKSIKIFREKHELEYLVFDYVNSLLK